MANERCIRSFSNRRAFAAVPSSQEEEAMLGKRVGVAFSAAIAVALIGLASWMLPASPGHAQDAPPLPLPDQGPANPQGGDAPGQEVLTNGPVHEAYAEPTALNPAAADGCSESASRAGRGNAAGREARRTKRRLDSRLLGLGRRPAGFHLGERNLARLAAESCLGRRILESRRRTAASNGRRESGRLRTSSK